MRDTLRKLAPAALRKEDTASEGDVHTLQGSATSPDGARGTNDRYHDEEKAGSKPPQEKSSKGYEDADPFGDEDEDGEGTKYRTLEWWQATMIMIAETISLGILSLPSVLARVGIVPGVLLILGLGVLATYSGYVIGQFKMKYPFVHTMADAGWILFKPLGIPRFGREFLGTAQVVFLIFSMASHVLTWTIALNTISDGATCTIVWSVIGVLIFWICDLPRTLKACSWLSIVSFISIFSAIMITMIGVGVDPKGVGKMAIHHEPFTTAFLSVSNIIFAYAGHVAFLSFISEFKNPQDFPKALVCLQISDTALYLIAAGVIYRYTGSEVTSPALGSAGPIVKKVAYGIAIPTIIVAGVIYGHVSTKYVFVRLFRGTKHLSAKSVYSYGIWAAIALTFWIIAWIIAESIPNFNDLLALISSLFASWFTYGLSGIFWLFMNYGEYTRNWKKMCLTAANVGLVLIGASVCGMGLYASGYSIHADQGQGASWTCKSNAQ